MKGLGGFVVLAEWWLREAPSIRDGSKGDFPGTDVGPVPVRKHPNWGESGTGKGIFTPVTYVQS